MATKLHSAVVNVWTTTYVKKPTRSSIFLARTKRSKVDVGAPKDRVLSWPYPNISTTVDPILRAIGASTRLARLALSPQAAGGQFLSCSYLHLRDTQKYTEAVWNPMVCDVKRFVQNLSIVDLAACLHPSMSSSANALALHLKRHSHSPTPSATPRTNTTLPAKRKCPQMQQYINKHVVHQTTPQLPPNLHQ
eukprot:1437850-Amphidinium_carterae.1